MQVGIPYEFTGADGTRFVVGAGAATADPDWVGYLNADDGISISREIRESAEPVSDEDGYWHGAFLAGRASISLQGKLDPHGAPTIWNAAEEKIRRAVLRCLKADGELRFTPDGAPGPRAYYVRAQQDPQFGAGRQRTFNIQLVSARPYAVSPEESSQELLYRAGILVDNPTVYWRLGEAFGPAAADEKAVVAGTYAGGVIFSQPGPLANDTDKSVYFDGANGRMTTTSAMFDIGGLDSWEGWGYRISTPTADTIFGGDSGEAPLFRLQSGSQDVVWYPRWTGGGVTWPNAWPGNDQWVYWVLNYDDNTRRAELFINGVSKGAQTVPNGYNASAGNFQLGAFAGPAGNQDFFAGRMDEVSIKMGVLYTAAQIAAHYNAAIGRITNAGTAPSWPRFRIAGPITNPRIENFTRGEAIRFAMTLAAGEYVDFWSDPLAPARLLFGPGRVNRYSWYDRPGSVRWPLDPGENDIRVTADALAAGASVIVYHRDAWN